jgi:hypothetical protein
MKGLLPRPCPGHFYPVNDHAESIIDLRAYMGLEEIPH